MKKSGLCGYFYNLSIDYNSNNVDDVLRCS